MAGQRVIVSILADTKKFSRAMKGLSREIGLTRLGEGFANAGRKVGRFFTNSLKVAGALSVAIAGLALKGGFERALNIEDAQAALRGLGHDAKSIDRIMDSALASVKGTAFGLGDAAQTASTAVAAGIEPGEKLTRTLKLTANAAALARTGLSEMGSILNKVWTAGRVQTQELNQIADRGIPIWTALADHYKVSATELRKMVSEGKVDAETFADVLENTVGTAADEMGKTTRGMAQNTLAALSRVGEGFLATLLPSVRDAMGGIMGWLDSIAPAVAEMGETFGKWITGTAIPAVKSLGEWLSGTLWPALRDVWELVSGAFREAIETISNALGDAGVSASKAGSSIGSGIVKAVRSLGPILAKVVKTIAGFVAWLIKARDIVAPYAVAIGTLVAAWAAFNKVMAIARAVQLAFNVALAMNPVGIVIAAITALVAGLTYFFTQTETGKRIWQAFTESLGIAWERIKAFFAAGFEAVKASLQRVWDFIKTVWSYSPIGLITQHWDKIVAFFKGLVDKVIGFFKRVWDYIKQFASYHPLAIIVRNWDNILAFFRSIPDKIKAFFSSAVEWLKSAGGRIITGLRNGLTETWSRVSTWVRDRRQAVIDVFRNAGQWLLNAGRNIIDGLFSGLREKWEGVKNWFGGIGTWIQQNKGPKAYDLALLRNAGRWIMQGLQDGLTDEVPGLRRTLTGVARVISGAQLGTLDANVAAAGAPGRVYEINVHALTPGPEVGRVVVDAIRAYERQNGSRR